MRATSSCPLSSTSFARWLASRRMLQSLTDLVSGRRGRTPSSWASRRSTSSPVVPSETSVNHRRRPRRDGRPDPLAGNRGRGRRGDPGDNIAYWIGRLAGHDRRALVPGRSRKRIDWAERQLQERGPYLIVVGRSSPRPTAVTLASGLLEMPWRRFILFDVLAGSHGADVCSATR